MVNINLARRQNVETQSKQVAKSGMQQIAAIAQSAGELYLKTIDNNETARINNDITKMNVDLMKSTEDWKTKYSANPNSKEGRASLQDNYKNIIDSYSGNFEAGKYRNQFMKEANTLLGKYSLTNEGWVISQNKVNTANQINDSIKNSLNEAYQTGLSGNVAQSAVNFETYETNLRNLGNNAIGQVETDKLLKNYRSDYAKSMIAGMIDSNPALAMKYLDDKKYVSNITEPSDVTQLKQMAMGRFGKISKENTIKELSGFSLQYGDKFNKAISGDMSSGELLQFIHGEGARLSNNAKKSLMKMAGYEDTTSSNASGGKSDTEYSNYEKAGFANELAIDFDKISKLDDKKKKVMDSDKKVEELMSFQEKLYDMYAQGKIDKSTFNNYNNLMLLPLQNKLTNSISRNRFWSERPLEKGFRSIDDATTFLGNFLGSDEEETLTAVDYLGAAAEMSAKKGRERAKDVKEDRVLYTDENRAQIATMFYRNLHNIIQQDTSGMQSIVDLEDMPEEKRSAYLMQAVVSARNSFLKGKYPQLAKQANMPEAVYEKGQQLAFALLDEDAQRHIKPTIATNQKIQKDPATGKFYIVEVNPKNNKSKIIRGLTSLEVEAYYGY